MMPTWLMAQAFFLALNAFKLPNALYVPFLELYK
jgi:hypothetical protein